MNKEAEKRRRPKLQVGQFYVRLPEWAAEELERRVEAARIDDPEMTKSGWLRRIVLAALKVDQAKESQPCG